MLKCFFAPPCPLCLLPYAVRSHNFAESQSSLRYLHTSETSQVTLDDLWKVDLVKLDGWQMVKDNTAGQDDFKEDAEASSESDGSWESDDEDGLHLPKVSAVAKKAA